MFDAIIVFGGGVLPDGTLTENSAVRVRYGVERLTAGAAPLLLFSGKESFTIPESPARTEAVSMADYAISLGCRPGQLLLEERSTDTLGNAYFVKKLFAEPREWKELLIVVAEYHVPRTQYICQLVFGPDYAITVEGAPFVQDGEERQKRDRREQASQRVLEEWSAGIADGDDAAIWQMMNTLHPGYAKNPKFSVQEVAKMVAKKEQEITAAE